MNCRQCTAARRLDLRCARTAFRRRFNIARLSFAKSTASFCKSRTKIKIVPHPEQTYCEASMMFALTAVAFNVGDAGLGVW